MPDPLRPIPNQCAALSHVGNVREVNEDSILSRGDSGVWVVADGMGGHVGGALASQTAISKLAAVDADMPWPQTIDGLEDAMHEADEQLKRWADERFDGQIIGTTVVAFVAKGMLGVCLWAGDSRLYECKEGALSQLTYDHDASQDFPDQAAGAGDSQAAVSNSNAITRALGAPHDLFVDAIAFPIHVGATYMLCSDGLYRELSEDRLTAHLSAHSVKSAAQDMITEVLDGPARDNVSAIVIRFGAEAR